MPETYEEMSKMTRFAASMDPSEELKQAVQFRCGTINAIRYIDDTGFRNFERLLETSVREQLVEFYYFLLYDSLSDKRGQ